MKDLWALVSESTLERLLVHHLGEPERKLPSGSWASTAVTIHVFKAMAEMGFEYILMDNPTMGVHCCTFMKRVMHSAQGDYEHKDIEVAIRVAALKALGVKVPGGAL